MKSIVNAEIGDAAIQQNYKGIIFEVAAGSGTITIDAKTNGTHVLNVQIGKAKHSGLPTLSVATYYDAGRYPHVGYIHQPTFTYTDLHPPTPN